MASVESRSVRAFLALPLAPAFEADVAPLIKRLKYDNPDIRWAQPSEIHITLHFFGSIQRQQIAEISDRIIPITQNTRSFEIFLRGIGAFPNLQRPRIVWMGADGEVEALKVLQFDIEKNLRAAGYPTEDRSFKPHLTLGRIKYSKRGLVTEKGNVPVTPPKTMEQIILFQSHLTRQGAYYEPLQAFPFSKA